ncbi:MAG: class I SAM-dependent methyltransferase [Phycisphaeraceae bacterium]|nr:class I SAM-dependent methyltransferase [Phycisphaeraceae bacterium]
MSPVTNRSKARGKAAGHGTAKNNGAARRQASRADPLALYLASVQEPSFETAFFLKAYRRALGRELVPTVLREDFCGTAAVCYQWSAEKKDRLAIGVDLDPKPIEWGVRNLAVKHDESVRERVILVEGDARDPHPKKADILAAQNFSFWTFKTRPELLAYLKAAHRNIRKQGIMILDMMGGPESMTENHEDHRWMKGPDGRFCYIWEQERINPVDHTCRYHISFKFKDGSQIRRAFTYEWRFWTMPEVRELALEAGFDEVLVFWEDTGKDGDGTGTYRVRENVPNDPSWVAYIVAVKQ